MPPSKPAFSRPRRRRASGAARTSCGPCAASCISMRERAEEVLTFEYQPAMAQNLGYTAHGGLRAVERFMKHYFLIAKEVGDLTTILCGALEIQQLKTSAALSRFFNPLGWAGRREVRQRTDFRVDNDRLNVADADVFKRDPVNLIRFFAHAEATGGLLASQCHPAVAAVAAPHRQEDAPRSGSQPDLSSIC